MGQIGFAKILSNNGNNSNNQAGNNISVGVFENTKFSGEINGTYPPHVGSKVCKRPVIFLESRVTWGKNSQSILIYLSMPGFSDWG